MNFMFYFLPLVKRYKYKILVSGKFLKNLPDTNNMINTFSSPKQPLIYHS